MTTQIIIDYLKERFGEDKIYMSNFRGWDFEMIMKHGEFNKEDIVLDTGALHSYFSVYLAQFVRQICAIDDMSWASRDYYAKAKLPPVGEWISIVYEKSNSVVIAEKADVMNLPYDDEAFHKVLSISTIEHVLDDKLGMSEMKRVLKPNGLLLLTTEYNEDIPMSYNNTDFIRIYDKAGIENLCQGFKAEERRFNHTSQSYAGISFGTLFIKLRKML